MLSEVLPPATDIGEDTRRWFRDAVMDVFVWCDEGGELRRFELSTRVGSGENAVTWDGAQGLRCYRVDAGEDDPRRNRSPILIDGWDACLPAIAGRFRVAARGMDTDLRDRIQALLRAGMGACTGGSAGA
ncbi:MAG: hypothetical protein ACPGU7_14530 [Gammaproteobacteria bacterium]